MTRIQHYFTQQDPNYRIKGSRDPLGFQRIWQDCGGQLIKHLSTVSSNIRDFQVLSFAWHFWGERDPKYFLPFFLKFEQFCGFARGIHFHGEGFNGVDFVNKQKKEARFTFSLKNQHTLLSNQRTYGILGKYARPYRDMQIKEDEEFQPIMEAALKEADHQNLGRLVERLIKEEEVCIDREDLDLLLPLLNRLTAGEQSFYRRKILQVEPSDHVQNELYHFLQDNPSVVNNTHFNLQPFLQELLRGSVSEKFRKVLLDIQHTEKVLYIYDGIFRTLQTSPNWQVQDLKQHPLFLHIPPAMDYNFRTEEMQMLNQQLNLDSAELIRRIVQRNGAISRRRNHSAPWIEFNEKRERVQVYYSEGKAALTEFKPDTEYGNSYFIESYLNLYRQIENIL